MQQKSQQLEICEIYSEKRSGSVNIVRSSMFWNKLENSNQSIDMSLLPPCRSSLKKSLSRASYVARMWRRAINSSMTEVSINRNHSNGLVSI